MLRILGHAASINVRKVLWLCEELGEPYDREDWGGAFQSTAEPEFRALNPAGLIPVIDDGGVVVRESNVILRYLAASRGRMDLLPADPAGRARVEAWMDWQASDFNNSWRVAFQGLVRRNPAMQDPHAIARSCDQFTAAVALVDAALADSGGHVAGPDFSLADIPIGLSIHRWCATPFPKPELAHVASYYDRLCERPGFARHGRDGGA